jgi:hypothetical protein
MDAVLFAFLAVAEAMCFFAMMRQAAEVPVGYEDDRGFHFGQEPLWADDQEF